MEQIYFGQRIAALRKERGMTQEALAQKLGITNQAVSKWESDQCCPDIMQLPALADIFEISLDACDFTNLIKQIGRSIEYSLCS